MNTTIFLALNASANPNAIVLALALFFSKYVPFLLMGFCAVVFIGGGEKPRVILFTVVTAATCAAIISWLIGHYMYLPRPFIESIGRTLLAHKDNASFPSNHMMFMTVFATTFILSSHRKMGWLFILLALAVGWSRIYLGLHFPLDILGGALVGIIVSALIWRLLLPRRVKLCMFFRRWPCAPAWSGNPR